MAEGRIPAVNLIMADEEIPVSAYTSKLLNRVDAAEGTKAFRADRFHVRGFNEQGTTTTPFQMVVLNQISRYHLAIVALQRTSRADIPNSILIERCRAALDFATAYAHEHFEDPPEIRDWVWSIP